MILLAGKRADGENAVLRKRVTGETFLRLCKIKVQHRAGWSDFEMAQEATPRGIVMP
jgi:hypothetical protein